MPSKLIIKKKEQIDENIINFLIDESFKLFVELYQIEPNNILTLKRLKEELESSYKSDIENNKFYTVYVNNQLVAAASIDNDNYFQDLFVKKEYQNLGIGGLLFEKVISDNRGNKEITMTVNPKQLSFFKKHQCEIIKEEDKSIMMRKK